MQDRYLDLIDRIIAATLKGEIRSKDQVYQMLQAEISVGTGELFERCLQSQVDAVEGQLTSPADDLQQAKATRKQRALKTIQGEWERWQQQNQRSAVLTAIAQTLSEADPSDQLKHLLEAIDPNQPQILTREQIQQLAHLLQQAAIAAPTSAAEESDRLLQVANLDELATGLLEGLKSWQALEVNVVSWIFEQGQQDLGFGASSEARGPWGSWAKAIHRDRLKALFNDLALHQSVTPDGIPTALSLADWVELAIVLQRLQLGLISWLDKQPYDPAAGKRLSIATFLTFTIVWSQISQRLSELGQTTLAAGCFQMTLQSLYLFAQQPYFPLYGGLFAALSGESLQTLLGYLDQPLRQVPNTQSKARILTLVGYSQRSLGAYQQAAKLHQWALDIAREAGDRPCEVANQNHLSRIDMIRQDYSAAINGSQRALILARQTGDRLGEANALANLGCSEVFRAQQQNTLDPDHYDAILDYLQRGLKLADQEGDRPSQALCTNSLGIAQIVLADYPAAIDSLRQGFHIAQAIGDLFLQGANCAYLSEAYRGMDNSSMAIYTGCLGMYLLHQIHSPQWRQPAGILSILIGQLGADAFHAILEEYRPQFLQQIGVDGYDHLPKLLAEYRASL